MICFCVLLQIWSCSGCYAIFHIQCIQKWVKDGVYQQVYKSDDDNIKPEDIPWHWYVLFIYNNPKHRYMIHIELVRHQ